MFEIIVIIEIQVILFNFVQVILDFKLRHYVHWGNRKINTKKIKEQAKITKVRHMQKNYLAFSSSLLPSKKHYNFVNIFIDVWVITYSANALPNNRNKVRALFIYLSSKSIRKIYYISICKTTN